METKPRHIGIDCAPGNPRPDHYLKMALDGVDFELDTDKTASRLFGAWIWYFEATDEKWAEVRPVIWKRLVGWSDGGLIRGAVISPA